MLVDAMVGSEFPREGEFWVGLKGWTILEQAQPNLLAVDTGSDASATLDLAQVLCEPMQAAVTVLGWTSDPGASEFKEEVKQRAVQAGLKEAEIHTASGELVDQVAAQCSRVLFELLIVPPRLTGPKTNWTPESFLCFNAQTCRSCLPGARRRLGLARS